LADQHDDADGTAPKQARPGTPRTHDGASEEYHSDLPPHTVDNLAAVLPGSLGAPVTSAAVTPRRAFGEATDDRAGLSTHTVELGMSAVPRPVPAATASTATLVSAQARADAVVPVRRDRSRSESEGRQRDEPEFAVQPESAGMLTPERLLAVNRQTRRAPRGRWNRFIYDVTLHLVNRGDSAAVRAETALEDRIRRQFEGGTRFVPILTRKGGVGKTTVTTLLGMALADVRDDRIIAIDANPDRGTLSERVSQRTTSTVRDVVTQSASIGNFTDFSRLVSRDETRLDILASDTDPMLSEAFDEDDYNVVADLAASYYSIALTDCGTGIVHSVMRATLLRADSIVIVSGGSVDEARLASETLTWLEANGYRDLVKNAVVALNTATQGTNLVRLNEIESHFRSRVREIVRIPYDPQLAAGSAVSYADLLPITRLAARTLAALVVEGLPARRSG